MTNPRPTFQISADTRLLYQRLIETKAGETATYSQLGEAISRKVEGGDPNLQSALNKAFRDDDMVFDNVRSVGYRRLSDEEIALDAPNGLARIKRVAKREGEKLHKVKDYETLSPDAKRAYLTGATATATLAAFASKKNYGAIESAVTKLGRELPTNETLKLFVRE